MVNFLFLIDRLITNRNLLIILELLNDMNLEGVNFTHAKFQINIKKQL